MRSKFRVKKTLKENCMYWKRSGQKQGFFCKCIKSLKLRLRFQASDLQHPHPGIGCDRRLLRRTRHRDFPRCSRRVGIGGARAAAQDVHHLVEATLRDVDENRFSESVRAFCDSSSRRWHEFFCLVLRFFIDVKAVVSLKNESLKCKFSRIHI